MHVLIFDSGLGGLGIYDRLRVLRPQCETLYLADVAWFPYGLKSPAALSGRITRLLETYVERFTPTLALIACNTASIVTADQDLEARLSIPIIRTTPEIARAAALSQTRRISVLATPATLESPHFRTLRENANDNCVITTVPCPRLAEIAERAYCGLPFSDTEILDEIRPSFQTDASGIRTDAIVLGCTHYARLLAAFERLAPWPVTWISSEETRAVEADRLLPSSEGSTQERGASTFFFTGKVDDSKNIEKLLQKRGVDAWEIVSV